MRLLLVLYLCFCWTPMVTSLTLHWLIRWVSTAAKKTTFNGQCLGELLRDHHLQAANTYFPVGATFFGPFSNTQIDFTCLPSSVRVHRCCALHHDGDRFATGSSSGETGSSPHPVCFSTPAHVWYAQEKARASMGQDQAFAGCPFCVGADRLFVTS